MFSLQITHDGKTSVFPLNEGEAWLLGRKDPCQIRVPDQRISSQHAEISRKDDHLVIRLTQGRNPIVMHGNAVKEAVLTAGSIFEIGDTLFTLVDEQDGMNLLDTWSVLKGTWQTANGLDGRVVPEADDDTKTAVRRVSPVNASPGRLVAQLSELMAGGKDREALAGMVLDLACQRLAADRAILAVVRSAERLELVAARGFDPKGDIAKLVSKSVLKMIVDQKRAVLIADTQRSDSKIVQQESVLRNEIKAVACTPVFDGTGDLYGLLYVDNNRRAAAFTVQEAELLIWLGQTYSLLRENMEMRKQLEHELSRLKHAAAQEGNVLAESPSMIQLLAKVKKAAASEANVLLMGESGTGKERIARLVHQQSPRAKEPIVTRNCAAIPENLFESEMFGHKKGAFSGAQSDRKGAFLEATGGTLFLDEIGELDYTLQTKLLRAIQEGTIHPVGSDGEVKVDVRLIAATNQDLRAMVQKKTFREDLFYRISTVILEIPPLRERPEDVPALAAFFVDRLSGGERKLSPEALEKLKAYHWPGNVRELLSVLEEAVIFSGGDVITPDDINLRMVSGGKIELKDDALSEVERRHILQILARANGNKTEAAKILGIARSTLVLKLKSYGQDTADQPGEQNS
ncbi:MAG: sigma 54-interacting transcriptional regulator [Planctomycetota bacterium]|nr:sigma 54-interacting transcriptional regulator [Planctomycetota bacterium]